MAAVDYGIAAVEAGNGTPEQQREVGTRLRAAVSAIGRMKSEVKKMETALAERKAPVRITLASDAKCAAARWCFSSAIKTKQAWIDRHDLFLSGNGRVYALVSTETEVFFMDCVTGSLFALGECMTSSRGQTGFKRDNEKAAYMLLNWNFEGQEASDETETEGD